MSSLFVLVLLGIVVYGGSYIWFFTLLYRNSHKPKSKHPSTQTQPPTITDDIIAEMGLAYLKKIGSVDRKDVIYHDFCEGAKAYRERLKTIDL